MISPLAETGLIAAMALITFLIRYPLLAVSGRLTLPPRLLQALQYVPPAVLTAIAVPAVVVVDGDLWISPLNPRLLGALAAIAMGLWRQNLLFTIAIGMGVFWLGQSLLP
ncbi:AzlD domain-containing protein [Leptolyngbya sp. PCC 6406]|uniref:AzlD domain-containing protein n=1 Tax=Leptolyngbya sp. PCC 6406 TaxID=1173264 RepID=UPI0002AC0A67|nr:AzlD domain-containing protein [Leptolyngbya sp. PCC 6406]